MRRAGGRAGRPSRRSASRREGTGTAQELGKPLGFGDPAIHPEIGAAYPWSSMTAPNARDDPAFVKHENAAADRRARMLSSGNLWR